MSTTRSLQLPVAIAAILATSACTGPGATLTGGAGRAGATVSVSVTPSSIQTSPGSQHRLVAVVTGTSDARVSWQLGEAGAGGAVTPDGLFVAPSSVGTYHVVATSVADPTRRATVTVTVVIAAPTFALPPERRTTWRPGILSDGPRPLGADGLPQRTTVCATVPPGGNIQAAIDGCPADQVVRLLAGTYPVASTVRLKSGVVLRGAGSDAATGTTIQQTGGGSVLAVGGDQDLTCRPVGATYALAADAAQEATTVTVGAAAAATFQVGDLALVDAVDDPAVISEGSCTAFKRVSGRSAGQRVEVTGVDAARGTLTLGAPLHWAYPAGAPALAQITRVTRPVTRWAGIEHLRVRGGTNPSYPGAMAGGIDLSNAAFCWVKDVQTDGTIAGMHVTLTGTYRCVVRDSVLRYSANNAYGADAYGVVLRCGAAENLVENNVVRFMNKPILFAASGGGNVVGYNYADNSWSEPASWQEPIVDTRCAFPHMELIEGNWAPHVGASSTAHGNAGHLTFFRNHASSQFALPAVTQTTNVAALQLDGGMLKMNVVGNVLGTAGSAASYDAHDSAAPAVYQTGVGGSGATDVAFTSLFRHGNHDFVHGGVVWDPGTPVHALPGSMYLAARPGWWPAGSPWPWVGPDVSPMVGALPAKQRSDAMGP